MNITTKISQVSNSARIIKNKSKFVLSLNIDIPLQRKFKIKDKIQQSKFNPKKILTNDQNYTLTLTNFNQNHHSQNSSNNQFLSNKNPKTSRFKFQSNEIFPKKLRKKQLIKTNRQRELKFIQDIYTENSLIKFTHQSSRSSYQQFIAPLTTDRVDNDVDLDEIRKYQHIAHSKKEYLHYQYLKEQFIITASVKKIQRAWRKYRTSKLIQCYSSAVSRLTYKQNFFEERSINSIKQKQINFSSQNQSEQNQYLRKKTIIKDSLSCEQEKKRKVLKNENIINEFQSEEIRKWDDLIQEIRSGKTLEEVLQKSYKRKQELQQQLLNYLLNQKKPQINLSDSESSFSHLNSEQSIIIYPQQLTNEQREALQNERLKKKLLKWEQFETINNIKNGSSSEKIKKKKQLIVPKIKIPKQIPKRQSKIEQPQEKQNPYIVSEQIGSLQSTGPKQKSEKVIIFDQENFIKNKLDLLMATDKLKLCQLLTDHFIDEVIQDFQSLKPIKLKIQRFLNITKIQIKVEGICTNLESIKDYLQNLVSFIFEYHLADILSSINKPRGPSPLQLFQNCRQGSFQIIQQPILNPSVFQQHWKLVSDQIYFDKKYQKEEKQFQRVSHLKNLTKIYFHLVFDAFNQSLQLQRIYGSVGQPYPWKSTHLFHKFNSDIKIHMKQAYRRIISLSTVYCGLHFDNRNNLQQNFMNEVHQQRMNNLLIMEGEQENYLWSKFEEKQTQILMNLAQWIEQQLLNKLIKDLEQIL